jgi:hypothetical protein
MFWNYPTAPPFYIAGATLLLVLLVPRVAETMCKTRYLWLLGAVAFVAGMILLPSRNHLLGDGLQRLSESGVVFLITEPLDTLVHKVVAEMVGSSLWSYRIVSFVAGLFYLNGIRLLMRFGETPIERGIIALAFLSTATIQFYFGYVESYGLLNVFVLYYIYYSWQCIRDKKTTKMPIVFFVLATASHLSGGVLLPSLLFVYKHKFGKAFNGMLWLSVAGLVVAYAIGVVQKHFVPLTASRYSTYTLFSGAHLLDMLWELLLVSPAFFLALFPQRRTKPMTFMALALAGTAVFTLIIDPRLGAVRDWDILALFALPLAGMIALRAPRRAVSVAILAAAIVARVIPWLVFNSHLQTEYVKKALSEDIHYTEKYSDGERLDSWGYLLWICDDFAGAEEVFKAKLRINPNWLNTLTMLGRVQLRQGKHEDACQTYLKLTQVVPDSLGFRYNASYLLFRTGRLDSAQTMVNGAPANFREDPAVVRLQAGILGAQGRHKEAIAMAEGTPSVDTDAYLPYMLARSSLAIARYDLARQFITKALEMEPFNSNYRKLANQIPGS